MITHHFHFVFFPTQSRFFDQQLIGRRQIQATFTDLDKLFLVISNTTTTAAHGKRRTNDCRKTDLCLHLDRFFHAVCDSRTGHGQANLFHRLAEAIPIFGLVDRIFGGADHFHVKFCQYTFAIQIQGTVQGGLPTHCRQQCIRTFFFNNLRQSLPINRFNVGRISHFGIGHDGRWIRVHQDDAVAFFLECFTGLGARIIKFTGLTDHNWTGTDDQDTFDVCSFWHGELKTN